MSVANKPRDGECGMPIVEDARFDVETIAGQNCVVLLESVFQRAQRGINVPQIGRQFPFRSMGDNRVRIR